MKKIRISIARAGAFGKLTLRRVDLGISNFVVISGNNESGKSTLAEMISWGLAGRRTGDQVDKKFLTHTNAEKPGNIMMDANLEGYVDDEPFTVSRKFEIRRKKKGQEPKGEEPVITLNTKSLTPAEWESTLRVTNERDFSRFYRITGPYDHEHKIDIKELFSALSINTETGISPRIVEGSLEKAADSIVSSNSGRGKDEQSFYQANSRLKAAKDQLIAIEGSKKKISELDSKIERDERRIKDLSQKILEARGNQGDLETARNLLTTKIDLDQAEGELKEIRDLEAWESAYENRADVKTCLTSLESLETEIVMSEKIISNTSHDLGISESELAALAIDRQMVIKISELQGERAEISRKIEDDLSAQHIESSKFESDSVRLIRIAEDYGTNFEQMMSLGEKPLDAQTFDDPIRDWDLASNRLQNEVGQKSENANSTPSKAASERRLLGIMGVSFILTTLTMLVDQKVGIGVAAIGIIATLVSFVISNKNRKQQTSPEQTTQNPKVSSNSNLNVDLKLAREKAREVLKAFGFDQDLSLAQAMNLRNQRGTIRELVQAINSASQEILRIDKSLEQRRERILEIDNLLARLKVSIGISQSGFQLSASLGEALLSLTAKRDELTGKQNRLIELRHQLLGLLGEWTSDTSISQIQLKFAEAVDLLEKRNELRTTVENARRSIAISAPEDSPVAELLANANINARVIEEKLNELASELLTLDAEKDEVIKFIAINEESLRELESLRDYPEAIHKATQAEAESKKHAVNGSAVWLAKKLVADVRNEVEAQHQPNLVKQASEIANKITAGYWSAIASDDAEVRVLQNGQWILEDALSAGARDVLRLSIRLAAARAHSQSRGVALPLILDDPTASLDKHRCPRLFEVLKEFAEDFQIILMTHDSAIVDLAVAAGATEVSLSPA